MSGNVDWWWLDLWVRGWKLKVETMRLFEADCNFVWFKESAINNSKFKLDQTCKNFKIEFFKNQKQKTVLFHSWLQISAFFKSLSGAAVVVERPCPFVSHKCGAVCSYCLDLYFYPRIECEIPTRQLNEIIISSPPNVAKFLNPTKNSRIEISQTTHFIMRTQLETFLLRHRCVQTKT